MEIQIQQVLLQVLNFAVLLFVVAKFLYKPILKILDERANKINEGLVAAEKSLAEQARIEELKKEEIVKAQKQAVELMEAAKKDAENMGKDIVAQAREEATRVMQREEAALLSRLEEQEKELKSKVGELVVTATRNLLKGELSSKSQQEILSKQIKEMKKLKIN